MVLEKSIYGRINGVKQKTIITVEYHKDENGHTIIDTTEEEIEKRTLANQRVQMKLDSLPKLPSLHITTSQFDLLMVALTIYCLYLIW